MDDESASRMGVYSSDRVEILYNHKCVIAIVNVAEDFPKKMLGVYSEPLSELGAISGETVEVHPAEKPESLIYIREKILGRRLTTQEIKTIVTDVVEQRLSDVELASFVTSLQIHGISMGEIEALCRAMIETGETLALNKKPILDKHSIGGVPGDKTTILVVPIISAAGFTIPKSSSRAVTSPAGTADRVEVLCPVELTLKEIKEVIEKVSACMIWGGTLDLAPADDHFIRVEYPLSIDPLLLPSIMSKKKAMGAEYVVIDIPVGRGSKIKTIGEAHALARDFIELGKRLGTKVECAITFGEQPIGYAIGPALEAREALSTLMGEGPTDLKEKATSIAGILFDMLDIQKGKEKADKLLKSGKAEKKLRDIIAAQGGDPKVTPEDIEIGDKVLEVISNKSGRVLWIDNSAIAQVARAAGAPKEKGAGVLLKAKIGDEVCTGEAIFEVYSTREQKLKESFKLAEKLKPIGLSEKFKEEMLIDRISTVTPHKKVFILER
jgi:AMP phosphorylase